MGSLATFAQTSTPAETKTLKPVVIKETAVAPEGKDGVRATTTGIGKGSQALRDIPQSVTVVTEKLVDDRNLDTLKDVLHNTAGVTFLAAEGGEEDIRLRGFSLATSGDIFVDGMRDPAFYDRDTFNNDRFELLGASSIGSSACPSIGSSWKKWSMTQMLLKPTPSAVWAMSARVRLMVASPPGQVKRGICSPIFIPVTPRPRRGRGRRSPARGSRPHSSPGSCQPPASAGWRPGRTLR